MIDGFEETEAQRRDSRGLGRRVRGTGRKMEEVKRSHKERKGKNTYNIKE